MIVGYNGRAYMLSDANYFRYLDDLAAGSALALDYYGPDAGPWGGDLSGLSPQLAQMMAMAVRAKLATRFPVNEVNGLSDLDLDRIAGAIHEDNPGPFMPDIFLAPETKVA